MPLFNKENFNIYNNIIVFLYLISILFIGLYNRSKYSSFKHYANVESSVKNNKLLLVATIFTSSVGGATTFGIAEKAFLGHTYYGYALILTVFLDILIATYIVPRVATHYGAQTIGDIMNKYYGNVGRLLSGISSIIVSVGFLAAQISVSGYIFQYILKIQYIEGVILSYFIVLLYTTIGGLQSIFFTNLLQFFAMIIAIPIITVVGVHKIGVADFNAQFMQSVNSFDQSQLMLYIFCMTLNFSVMNLYPTFIQRALINKNSIQTTTAIYIKSVIYVLFLICIIFNGLISYNFYPGQQSYLAIPYLINQIVPSVLQGLVITGLLATVMSTADSDLNIISVSMARDIFEPILHTKSQQKLLSIARISNIIVGSLAVVIALKFSSIVDLVVFITGFWGPVILIPFVMALFHIVIPTRRMLFTSLGGATSFLLWEYYDVSIHCYNLKGVFVGTFVSFVAFITSYLLSPTRSTTSLAQNSTLKRDSKESCMYYETPTGK